MSRICLRLLLPIMVMVALSEARIQEQCMCEQYNKCEKKFKVPATSFKRCLKMCKEKVSEEIPEEYIQCLAQFNLVLSKTLKCTHKSVGTGCTSREKNVLSRRNFTLFEDIFLEDFQEIAKKADVDFAFKSEAAENMNHCLLGCYYPAENTCTRVMKCGLFMPNELRLMDNLTKCALRSGVTREIMLEIAACMRSVTEKPENDDYEDTK